MSSSLFNTKPVFLLLNCLSPWQRFGIALKKKKGKNKKKPHTLFSPHGTLPSTHYPFRWRVCWFTHNIWEWASDQPLVFSDCVMDTNSPTGVCVLIEQQKQHPFLWCALTVRFVNGSVWSSLLRVLSVRYTQMGPQPTKPTCDLWTRVEV